MLSAISSPVAASLPMPQDLAPASPAHAATPAVAQHPDVVSKMQKNLRKALSEHTSAFVKQFPGHPSPFITEDELEHLLHQTNHQGALNFDFCATTFIGRRQRMEDEHTIFDVPGIGKCVAIFDGHGGRTAATYAKEHIADVLIPQLHQYPNDFRRALTETLKTLHTDRLHWEGSTAVVALIDTRTNTLYTATLGDSEFFVYRTIGETRRCIPLSCLRDWNSRSDIIRMIYIEYHHLPEELKHFPKERFATKANAAGIDLAPFERYLWRGSQGKNRRSEWDSMSGINLSRSLGDLLNTAISQKPKVTCYPLHPADTLLGGCDGVFDTTHPSAIMEATTSGVPNPSLAVANIALQGISGDNITAIVIRVTQSVVT